jgi:pyruvate dehydrogenase E1 component beta subunit
LRVVSPVTPADAKGMMLTAIRDPDPVIFLEAGALYGTKGEVPDGDVAVPFGKARVAKEGNDVTLIGYGRQVNMLLRVADKLQAEDKVDAEVIDLRTIRPFDEETIVESVRKTHRAVVVQEHAFDDLDAPVARVSGAEVPAPYARNLELAAFPSEQQVIQAVRQVLYREA